MSDDIFPGTTRRARWILELHLIDGYGAMAGRLLQRAKRVFRVDGAAIRP